MTIKAKTHSPISVANYLLKRDKTGLEKLKLIKLVYLCHAWHLAKFGAPLVDELAEAWSYGPIYPSIYLRTEAYEYDEPVKFPLADGGIAQFTKAQRELVDGVYDEYGHLGWFKLVLMSHRGGTPWDVTWTKIPFFGLGNPSPNRPIPNKLIKQYYGVRSHG